MTMSNTQRDACGGGVATDSKVADRAGNPTEVGGLSDISLEKYKMDHKRRGLALIFNQENFHWELRMKPRCGTDADRRNLEERLKALNFEVQPHTDLKKEKVLEKIREAAEADHVDEDCFVCVFLTHGEEDMIYAHDEKFSIKDITAFFKGDKCQSLVGKPKIFILQACRGEEYDNAVTGMAAGDSVPEENQVVMNAGVVHTLPAGADFLMCYSVGEGYYSFRDTVNGSWYIQDLCQTLQRSAGSLEFLELLTLVNMKVSRRTVERAADHNAIGKKQIPCFASMLTKQLYF